MTDEPVRGVKDNPPAGILNLYRSFSVYTRDTSPRFGTRPVPSNLASFAVVIVLYDRL
jgi:hypothetical protein